MNFSLALLAASLSLNGATKGERLDRHAAIVRAESRHLEITNLFYK
jgi:hypothetical protein